MRKSNWRSFEEARVFVHQLQLKSSKEWSEWAKSESRPDDIPFNPHRAYKDKGWISFGDWFGTGTIAAFNRIYLSFEDARIFVQNINLKSKNEWAEWSKSDKKPDNIPANPPLVYKDRWLGWGDWLGTGTIAAFNRIYLSFEDARIFVRQLELKNRNEWLDYVKSGQKPENIPAYPHGVYKNDGWISMGDWLGSGSIASFNRVYRPFEEARRFVHQLHFKNREEWLD